MGNAFVYAHDLAAFASVFDRVPSSKEELAAFIVSQGGRDPYPDWIAHSELVVEWGITDDKLSVKYPIFTAKRGPLRDKIKSLNAEFYNFYNPIKKPRAP